MDLAAFVCSSIWLVVVAVLITRAARQRDLLPRLAPAPPSDAGAAPRIAIIVPARDEAANIGPCVATLLEQDFPPDRCQLIVIDDQSRDGTADIVAAMGRDVPRLKLVRSPPLPRGWIGKSHACWLGVCAADPATEWLCFVDADMRAAPRLLASALHAASAERLDLLSLTPRHELKSFAERLVIPCGLFLLAFLQDLGSVQSRASRDVTATGQFMLVRAPVYAAVGGHAAVRGAICEDLELARRCKRAGWTVLLKDGSHFLSGRMYTGWRTLWPGFAKNLVDMLGGARATAVTALGAAVLAGAAWAVPVLALAAYAHGATPIALAALVAALASSVAITALHVAGTIHFRIPFWYGLVFPLGYTVGALIAADSIRQRRQRRVAWKGRVYT
ncbi:MAG TPA: glycosyltransferase family A protein [Xanthobacteraceae bacterium]|nr:glycosyltransferase family A protein [Xanthobacteraceae bacterium]